jgi:hypothetical protein
MSLVRLLGLQGPGHFSSPTMASDTRRRHSFDTAIGHSARISDWYTDIS